MSDEAKRVLGQPDNDLPSLVVTDQAGDDDEVVVVENPATVVKDVTK